MQKQLSVQHGLDPVSFPSTMTDCNKINALRDSPRIQFLNNSLQVLVEKISSTDPKASLGSLKVEISALLGFFEEIFESNKATEMNALRVSIRKLGLSGRARILTTISYCKEITDSTKNSMIKMILDEVP